MPLETQEAVNWALQQTITTDWGETYPVTKESYGDLVEKVREYFNTNKIEYTTFSYDDLQPYLSN